MYVWLCVPNCSLACNKRNGTHYIPQGTIETTKKPSIHTAASYVCTVLHWTTFAGSNSIFKALTHAHTKMRLCNKYLLFFFVGHIIMKIYSFRMIINANKSIYIFIRSCSVYHGLHAHCIFFSQLQQIFQQFYKQTKNFHSDISRKIVAVSAVVCEGL